MAYVDTACRERGRHHTGSALLGSQLVHAEFAGVPEEVARRMRDEFYTKDMLSTNSIAGLDAIAKEAAKAKQIWAPLSRKQTAELVQIPATRRVNASSGGGWFRGLAPK